MPLVKCVKVFFAVLQQKLGEGFRKVKPFCRCFSAYLGLCLQQHRLAVLWLHFRLHWPVLYGRGLARQRVGELHEEQLVAFAEAPLVQQVGQNLGLWEWRRLKNCFCLLYFRFLWLLFYCRQNNGGCKVNMICSKLVIDLCSGWYW